MTQGIPGLDDNALVGQEGLQLLLLGVGVDLRLENGGLHLAQVQDLLNLLGGEVGQADGLHLALFVCLLHELVPGDIIAGGLVDEQQVDVVGAQPLQGLVHRVRLLVKGGPQLGLQEDVLSVHAGLFDGPAHRLLVHIGVGGVDEAVAAPQGAEDGGFRLVGGEQEGSDASHGHFHAVVQGRVFHTKHPF